MLKKIAKKLPILCTMLMLTSCGGNADPRNFSQLTGSDKLLYEEALADIGENNKAAIDKLNVLELNYPKSSKLPEAMILKLYALYANGQYSDAILQADKFISLYPQHQSTPYAYYIKGLANQKKMMDSQRDQTATEDAINTFMELEQRFPHSEYVVKSKTMTDSAQNIVAIKHVEIGRSYAAKGQHSAAAERFQTVLKNYPNSEAAPEAIYRMVEIHTNLNSHDNAHKYCKMLQDQYPNSDWTQRAIKITTTSYSVNKPKYYTKDLMIPGEETGFYNAN